MELNVCTYETVEISIAMAFRQTVVRKYAHAQLVEALGLRKGKKVSCKTTVQYKINVKI